MEPNEASAGVERCRMYRSLSDPMRQKILALAEQEELSIGELGFLLSAAQPKVSRQVSALRLAGLLAVRKEGTRVWVQSSATNHVDTLVADATANGMRMAKDEGLLERIAEVLKQRDQQTKHYFTATATSAQFEYLPLELPAYLFALKPVMAACIETALDVGTGDGAVLDALAPLYNRVIGLDRAAEQLKFAEARVQTRGYTNVELLRSEYEITELKSVLPDFSGVDLVIAARLLHHAPRPAHAMRELGKLLRAGGHLIIVDYRQHHDEQMRELQADTWLGFKAEDLRKWALDAGLSKVEIRSIPKRFCGKGRDAKLGWQVLHAEAKEKIE
ncbi:MAG: methyltransferase domain-containing protein [Myxococcales bacterium]|nr:MAG: methyltransferase domain-containing protein [Myxococcales bacterium]